MLNQYISNPYLRAVVIGGCLLIILAICVNLFARIVKFVARKTKRNFEKSQFKRFVLPILIIIFLSIIRLSTNEISVVNPNLNHVVGLLIYSVIVITLGYVLFIILDIFALSWWRKISERTPTKIDDNLISIIHGVLQISLIVLGIIFILDLWGIEVSATLAGLGIAGLAVALALQPTLSNIFSGISIIFDKSLREGDIIYLEEQIEARVEKIGLRSTKVRTSNDETIIIPNNKLAENRITNASLPEPKMRIAIPFSVAYGIDIERVKKIVINELQTIKGVLKNHTPFVRFIEMKESCLKFEGYFYINLNALSNKDNAIDEANTKIYNALLQNNIQIPFPQLDVHMKNR